MRLAYEQGLLRGNNLSYTQYWALLYWIYMDRRVAMEDSTNQLIQQTFNLFPERFEELYRPYVMRQLGLPYEDTTEIPVEEDDLDRVNEFLARIEASTIGRPGRFNPAELGLPPDWKPDTKGVRV